MNLKEYIDKEWELCMSSFLDYLKVPNKSPVWYGSAKDNKEANQAMEILSVWVGKQNVKGLELIVDYNNSKSPFMLIKVEGTKANSKNILLYGHMDKQPPMYEKWSKGQPYDPKVINGKLYARGAVDGGYAIFSFIIAIKALKKMEHLHDRFIIVIEGSEESGSVDLQNYLDTYSSTIGYPETIYCLNSGGPTEGRLWLTSSMRGHLVANLTVKMLDQSVHTGHAGGIIHEPYTIASDIMNRVKNNETHEINPILCKRLPEKRYKSFVETAAILGTDLFTQFPYTESLTTIDIKDPLVQLNYYINNVWKPSVSVIGVDGIPSLNNTKSHIYPQIRLKLSMHIPPTARASDAYDRLKSIVLKDAPFGAHIDLESVTQYDGVTFKISDEVREKINTASILNMNEYTGNIGCGGFIAYAYILVQKYQDANCVLTGIFGPKSNVHNGNENLDLENVKKLTTVLVEILK